MRLLKDKVKYEIYAESETHSEPLIQMHITDSENSKPSAQIPDHLLKKTTYQYQYSDLKNNSFG